jgi:signal peptidase I
VQASADMPLAKTEVMKLGIVAVALVATVLCGCRDAVQASSSMAPTIKAGERVKVDHTAYAVTSPKRWDVIAFTPPFDSNAVFIMRVVGMPGETVAFASNVITVNSQPLLPPPSLSNIYLKADYELPAFPGPNPPLRGLVTPPPYLVPQNSYFVLGDNLTNAHDSRYWGAVSATNILGRVRNQ